MENIRSRNVYLEMSERKEEERNEASSKNVDYGASIKERKRKLPSWTKSTEGEEAKYADWTLDVTLSNDDGDGDGDNDNDDATNTVSYSIHRYSLGLQSEYFEGIFRDPDEGGFSESHQRRSAIKLYTPIVTIHHFENLLDYLYTGKLVLDSDSAVAMVYFGDYFGINLLKEQAQSFIRKSVAAAAAASTRIEINSSATSSSKLLANFYQQAKHLVMEDLQEAIVLECASKPTLMSKDAALSKIPDVQFWCRVLCAAKKFHPQTELSNKLWSANVANFIELHSDIVDRKSFYELTHKDSLPIISAKAAIVLMEQQQQQRSTYNELGERDKLKYTCLQKRCIDSLVDSETGDWKVSKPHTFLEGKLGNMPHSMLESLLLRTMDGDRKKPHRCRDSIRVSGAGSESVNGVYIRSGLYKGYPMFTRSGTYEGRNELFYIYKYHTNFYISTVPEGWKFGERKEIDFYETNHTEDKLPPDTGWKIFGRGQAPLPILQIVYV